MRSFATFLVLALSAGFVRAADVELLFASGTVVDGTGIYNVSKPRGVGKRSLTFLGATSALVHDDGTGVRTTVLATGDPLPAPLAGTFNRIVRLESHPTGPIAFFANLNALDAEAGFFILEDGVVEPAVLDPDVDDGTFGNRFAVNAAGDLAYFDTDGLRRRERATGTITPIGIAGGSTLRDVAIDDTGAIAWHREGRNAAVGSVGYWSAASGIVTVAMEGDAGPLGTWDDFDRRRTGIALDATEGLAFTTESTSNGGAFLWTPPAGPTRVLAMEGDLVGTEAIRRVRGNVRFAADGAVVFAATIGPAARLVDVRAKDGLLSEATASADPFYEVVGSSSVYGRRGRHVAPIVGAGDAVPDLGPLASVDDYETDGRATAVLGRLEDDRAALAWRRGTLTRKVAVDGDALPFGPFAGGDVQAFAVAGDSVGWVDLNGHVVLKNGEEPLQWLNLAPGLGVGETWTAKSIRLVGKRVLVSGVLERIDPVTFATELRTGLFEIADDGLSPVVVEGEPTGARTPQVFTSIASFEPVGRQLLLLAAADASGTPGIGIVRRGRASFVATAATSLPVGVPGPVVPDLVLPLGGGRLAFRTTLTDATGTQFFPTVLALRGSSVTSVLYQGESTNLGVVDLSSGPDVTMLGRTVVVTGTIPGTRSALLARRAGRSF